MTNLQELKLNLISCFKENQSSFLKLPEINKVMRLLRMNPFKKRWRKTKKVENTTIKLNFIKTEMQRETSQRNFQKSGSTWIRRFSKIMIKSFAFAYHACSFGVRSTYMTPIRLWLIKKLQTQLSRNSKKVHMRPQKD